MTDEIICWPDFIRQQSQLDYFLQLRRFVTDERERGKKIYPPADEVYSAFDLTPLSKVRVVLLGQDPYHGEGQAHGLCFSVKPGIKIPPSLSNIYKELACDIDGFKRPDHGYLVSWANQGILMLNTVLTVEQGQAHSHAKAGWEIFTDNVMRLLNQQQKPLIFVLWGGHALNKGKLITQPQHQLITSAHPSPLSAYRGFLGNRHFSKINQLLCDMGETPIQWQV